jgi:hypothetical protein
VAIELLPDVYDWCFIVEYYFIVLSKDENSPDCGMVIKNYLNNTVSTIWNRQALIMGQQVCLKKM